MANPGNPESVTAKLPLNRGGNPGFDRNRFRAEQEEESQARSRAGLMKNIPERTPFATRFDRGVPNCSIDRLVRQMVGLGYFPIGAHYQVEPLGKRDEARLSYSRKESDRALMIEAPTLEQLSAFMDGKRWGHVHLHDRRRIHAGTGEEIGNNGIDLLGRPANEEIGTWKELYLKEEEEVRYVIDVFKKGELIETMVDGEHAPLSDSLAREPLAKLGDVVRL